MAKYTYPPHSPQATVPPTPSSLSEEEELTMELMEGFSDDFVPQDRIIDTPTRQFWDLMQQRADYVLSMHKTVEAERQALKNKQRLTELPTHNQVALNRLKILGEEVDLEEYEYIMNMPAAERLNMIYRIAKGKTPSDQSQLPSSYKSENNKTQASIQIEPTLESRDAYRVRNESLYHKKLNTSAEHSDNIKAPMRSLKPSDDIISEERENSIASPHRLREKSVKHNTNKTIDGSNNEFKQDKSKYLTRYLNSNISILNARELDESIRQAQPSVSWDLHDTEAERIVNNSISENLSSDKEVHQSNKTDTIKPQQTYQIDVFAARKELVSPQKSTAFGAQGFAEVDRLITMLARSVDPEEFERLKMMPLVDFEKEANRITKGKNFLNTAIRISSMPDDGEEGALSEINRIKPGVIRIVYYDERENYLGEIHVDLVDKGIADNDLSSNRFVGVTYIKGERERGERMENGATAPSINKNLRDPQNHIYMSSDTARVSTSENHDKYHANSNGYNGGNLDGSHHHSAGDKKITHDEYTKIVEGYIDSAPSTLIHELQHTMNRVPYVKAYIVPDELLDIELHLLKVNELTLVASTAAPGVAEYNHLNPIQESVNFLSSIKTYMLRVYGIDIRDSKELNKAIELIWLPQDSSTQASEKRKKVNFETRRFIHMYLQMLPHEKEEFDNWIDENNLLPQVNNIYKNDIDTKHALA